MKKYIKVHIKKNNSKEKEKKIINLSFTTKKIIFINIFMLCLSLLLILISRCSVRFCDIYVKYMYSISVNTLGRILGILPFSVVEIGLYLFVIILVTSGVILIISRFRMIKRVGIGILTLSNILFLMYVMNCGINYGHTSYSKQAGISEEKYSTEELIDMCIYLTDKVNEYSVIQQRDLQGIMKADGIQKKAKATMEKIGEKDDLLKGYYPIPKPVANSYILSVQQLAGVYSPFTIEANYNKDMPAFEQAFTACHELSHLRGYMQEEEANYIAFIACIDSDYNSFKYGGYIEGWLYATGELYLRDSDKYLELYDMLCEEAKKDLIYNDKFWEKYEGEIAQISDKVNDTYLKANGQENGVLSYDRVVGLMIDWWKNCKQFI